MTHTLVARLDNDGDVLLTGPAIRAVAAGSSRVTLLCGPRGAAAARLLPGVDEIVCFRAPWIDPEPGGVDRTAVTDLVERLAGLGLDSGVLFTSFHQSPLPLALLLRLAGVPRLGALSEDYPGSLLDVRHRGLPPQLHEVQRALSLAAACGYPLPEEDDAVLRVRGVEPPDGLRPGDPYVVLHPGASVPARAWSPQRYRRLAALLISAGHAVVVTGAPSETTLTAVVAEGLTGVHDLGGRTSLPQLAGVLQQASAVVVGNTGPAHLSAAVGTPLVSLFAPTVPLAWWRPWRVPHEVLFAPVACAGCRARTCPVPGHPCLDGQEDHLGITPETVLQAVGRVLGELRGG